MINQIENFTITSQQTNSTNIFLGVRLESALMALENIVDVLVPTVESGISHCRCIVADYSETFQKRIVRIMHVGQHVVPFVVQSAVIVDVR